MDFLSLSKASQACLDTDAVQSTSGKTSSRALQCYVVKITILLLNIRKVYVFTLVISTQPF